MAATPPRSTSPAPRSRPVFAPKPGHNLQISPNLEALLQHDELTRRSSSSPTSLYHSSPSSEFPISLPPPPPRKANGGRKSGQREQEPLPTTRSKEGQRGKNAVVVCDSWPDALPGTNFLPDGATTAGQSTSGSSSRPVTPNPYLNPTPVLEPINTPDIALADEAPTPKQVDRSLPNEPKSTSSQACAETRARTSASDPSHRPSTALHKVEKMLWMGRDSLSLFSGSANAVKRDSDRRNDRTEFTDQDAVQDVGPMRQVPVVPTETLSRPASRYGDIDTATASLSSNSGSSYLHFLQQGSPSDPSEADSHPTRSDSGPSPVSCPPAHLLPRLSLPSIFMPNNSSERQQSADDVAGNDYLSFIDFFGPSTSDDPNLCNIQDNTQEISSRRRLPSISIPSSGLYSMSHYNRSSGSLPSMRFAPPSPTVHQPSPTSPGSGTCPSPAALSMMRFAPPSPSSERAPSRLQPLSGPPSPYSPVEFALPHSPPLGTVDDPSLPTVPGLACEHGRKLKSKKRSKSSSPCQVRSPVSPLPPTTNELGADERADRIRRNRKLARVFGRAPGVEEPMTDVEEPRTSKKLHPPALAALLPKQKNHRHAVSVSVSVKTPETKTEPSTPWQTEERWSPDGRRHSTPLATGFTLYVDDEQHGTPAEDACHSREVLDSSDAASTRSFIDLSEEDVHDDDVSELSCFTLHPTRHHRLHHSTSTPSLVESLDSVAQVELERRQKREKLARLHRFLGSSVPPEAVNGCVFGPPLPPPAPVEGPGREHRRCGNKNAPQDRFDRGGEQLDEREKALNVRRAQKMERVFGTAPPQVLFHTRPPRPTVPLSQPTSFADRNPFVLTLDLPCTSRNQNQSAYVGKTLHRPGPSDSSQCLLPWKEDTTVSSPVSLAQSFADSFAGSLSGYQQVLAQSSVYLNYQHSLNSLVDIIDRDDRQSLFELHRFLHSEADDSPSEEEMPMNPRRSSNATSLRSERRHSLPSKASMTSLSSEFYAAPETSPFQIRRRMAAKLTNFFGVDYRVLIHDVLESIEKGVEEERKQGTLQPQEAEVLMHRVRSLRTMQDPAHSS